MGRGGRAGQGGRGQGGTWGGSPHWLTIAPRLPQRADDGRDRDIHDHAATTTSTAAAATDPRCRGPHALLVGGGADNSRPLKSPSVFPRTCRAHGRKISAPYYCCPGPPVCSRGRAFATAAHVSIMPASGAGVGIRDVCRTPMSTPCMSPRVNPMSVAHHRAYHVPVVIWASGCDWSLLLLHLVMVSRLGCWKARAGTTTTTIGLLYPAAAR